MLALFCVQVVQTNKNESKWRKKKNNFQVWTSKKYVDLPRKQNILIKKSSWQYIKANT
jgi:hypothetical protein